MTPMKQIFYICPCCGSQIVITQDDGIAVGGFITGEKAEKLASRCGIEIGALKGGEKIGD